MEQAREWCFILLKGAPGTKRPSNRKDTVASAAGMRRSPWAHLVTCQKTYPALIAVTASGILEASNQGKKWGRKQSQDHSLSCFAQKIKDDLKYSLQTKFIMNLKQIHKCFMPDHKAYFIFLDFFCVYTHVIKVCFQQLKMIADTWD